MRTTTVRDEVCAQCGKTFPTSEAPNPDVKPLCPWHKHHAEFPDGCDDPDCEVCPAYTHAPIYILSPDGNGVRSVFACSCGASPATGAQTMNEMADWYNAHAAENSVEFTPGLSAATYGPGYAAAGKTHHEWAAQHPGVDPFTGTRRTREAAVVRRCTGPNPACRKAHKAGRSIHIIPAYSATEPSLVLPFYHFETEKEAVAAVTAADKTAPTVTCDADLYAYREQGIAHKLPIGWIDPDRRRCQL